MDSVANQAGQKRGQTRAERIEALERKAVEIQAKAKALRAAEKAARSKADRKLDTRRKVVLGAVVMDLLRRGVIDGQTYDGWIAGIPERDRDLIARSALCPAPDPGAAEGSDMALRSET